MLILPGSILALATLLFVGMALLVYKEQQAGKRKVLGRVRGWLDRRADSVIALCKRAWSTITISCVYLVHQIRHAAAAAIAPRPRARKPKPKLEFERTDNHLSSMHDHKSDTALSTAQKKKLRNKKLEERF